MKHDAKAIGSGSEAAQAELQDQYKKVCRLLLRCP
jgi:20S proteasome alpha/beta subunit